MVHFQYVDGILMVKSARPTLRHAASADEPINGPIEISGPDPEDW